MGKACGWTTDAAPTSRCEVVRTATETVTTTPMETRTPSNANPMTAAAIIAATTTISACDSSDKSADLPASTGSPGEWMTAGYGLITDAALISLWEGGDLVDTATTVTGAALTAAIAITAGGIGIQTTHGHRVANGAAA